MAAFRLPEQDSFTHFTHLGQLESVGLSLCLSSELRRPEFRP